MMNLHSVLSVAGYSLLGVTVVLLFASSGSREPDPRRREILSEFALTTGVIAAAALFWSPYFEHQAQVVAAANALRGAKPEALGPGHAQLRDALAESNTSLFAAIFWTCLAAIRLDTSARVLWSAPKREAVA